MSDLSTLSPRAGAARTAAIRQCAARASLKARSPLFGRYGHAVVAVGCVYEVLALLPGSPLPTLTELGRRHPAVKWSLTGALVHHWHLERSVLVVVPDIGG